MLDSGRSPPVRYMMPLVATSLLALVIATWLGLWRMGWAWADSQHFAASAHGPLMICGFLGTLIGVERAVALRRRWVYAGPAATALGALLTIVGLGGVGAALLITLGSAILVAAHIPIVRRERQLFAVVLGLGALFWLLGNVLWLLGFAVPMVVLWWVGFPLFTIIGERLELSRVLRPRAGSQQLFVLAAAVFCAGPILIVLGGPDRTALLNLGWRVAGLGMLVLAGWLMRYDLARFTVRRTGVTRYIAVCLLSGYAWLAVSGILALYYGAVWAGPRYDAVLHAFFVGFVISMIFGHAPLVMPAVLGRAMVYHPLFYGHLLLLHVSLVLRVLGDVTLWMPARQWGGLLNAVALAWFLVATLASLAAARSTTSLHADGGHSS